MATKRITATAVRELAAGSKLAFIWDTEVKGFGCRCTPNGVKSYVIQYRNVAGRQKMMTIGRAGVWTTSAARKEAIALRREIDTGGDPLGEIEEVRTAPTMNSIFDRYLEEHCRVRNKPSTIESNEENIDVVLRPKFGKLKLIEMDKAGISAWHLSMKSTPHRANRCLAILKKVLNLCEQDWELLERSPARNVKAHKVNDLEPTQRALDRKALSALGVALRTGNEHEACVSALRLLLMTGMRVGELLNLRWKDVEAENRRLRVVDGKAGARNVHLNDQAMAVLSALTTRGEFVLERNDQQLTFGALRGAWRRVKSAAGIKARLHDLRHTHATLGAAAGLTAWDVMGLMGHKNIATSQLYVAGVDDRLRQASSKVGDIIGKALED